MTIGRLRKTGSDRKSSGFLSLMLLSLTLLLGMIFASEGAEYVKDGMRLAVGCVIPSSFPFMILSDIYVAYGRPENIGVLRWAFTKLFGMPASGLGAFICGNLGGFPIGAKMCAELYTAGRLERSEAERLIALSNNPSFAFVVGGVGIGMLGDIGLGFLLYFSILTSTVICGIIARGKTTDFDFIKDINRQNYNFVESVKRSGTSCVSIIAFISTFSVICGIIKNRVKNALILYPFFALCEVTNAVDLTVATIGFSLAERLALCAFALGFGGVSVGMQSAIFTSSTGLKMRKYYLIKLLSGMLSASIASLIFLI